MRRCGGLAAGSGPARSGMSPSCSCSPTAGARVQMHEHESAPRVDGDGHERELRRVVVAHGPEERRAPQPAVERVRPRVVRAADGAAEGAARGASRSTSSAPRCRHTLKKACSTPSPSRVTTMLSPRPRRGGSRPGPATSSSRPTAHHVRSKIRSRSRTHAALAEVRVARTAPVPVGRRGHRSRGSPTVRRCRAEEPSVWIPMSDGASLSARLYVPEGDDRPWPVLLEALPYRKDDLTASYASEYRRLRDEGRFAVGARRPPRHRRVGGPRDRRVPARGADRPARGDRVARRAAVVERQRRHVRHLVLGLQLAAARGRAAAGDCRASARSTRRTTGTPTTSTTWAGRSAPSTSSTTSST